jgi:serine/threonine-protein kinase
MSQQKCVKCGAAMEQGARFCGGCGTQQPGAVIPQAAVRTGAKTIFQGSGGGVPAQPVQPKKSAQVAFDATIAPGTPAPLAQPAPQPAQPAPQAARPATAGGLPPFDQSGGRRPAAQTEWDGDLTGKTLNNRYQVEVKIGEGGFGAVYRAKQVQMGRVVALKVLHAKMAKDPQVIGRFKREAQASSLLRAPHTVQVYDFDQSPEGIMYLAMEMLQGKSLHDILKDEGPIEHVRLAKVMDGIADSLGEAHQQGIVHRDIKPENIFLEPRPTPDFVKVLDFGIAKIVSGDGLQSSGPALTAAGQTLGTLEYMSPEQLMGAQLDGRSDLYALGIMAYELVTGALPFPSKTPGEMITAHLKTMPPPPSKAARGRNISPLFDQIILKLVAKNRDHRYKDTAELRADLKRVVDGERGEAPAAQPQAAPEQPKPQQPKPQPMAQPVRPVAQTDRVQTNPPAKQGGISPATLGIIIGVVLAVAGIVGSLLWWSSHK